MTTRSPRFLCPLAYFTELGIGMWLMTPAGRGDRSWSWGTLCLSPSCVLFILISLIHQGSLVFTSGLTDSADPSKGYLALTRWYVLLFKLYFFQNICECPLILSLIYTNYLWEASFLRPHGYLGSGSSVAFFLLNGHAGYILGLGALETGIQPY